MTVPVPADTDYTMRLETARHRPRPLPAARQDQRLAEARRRHRYLAHSRVTEQRAVGADAGSCCKHFGDHPEIGRAVRAISHDEDNHLAYCHEELLRLAAYRPRPHHPAHPARVRAPCEIRIYRDVSLAVMAHMSHILGWPRHKIAVLHAAIHATYA